MHYLISTAPPSLRASASPSRIGAWRLLQLKPPFPYTSARRNSRVPKLLSFRFFPRANYSLWVDGKLKLLVAPMQIAERMLIEPQAHLSLARNLRRSTIEQEMAWIRSTLGSKRDAIGSDALDAVERQWAFYLREQGGDGKWCQSNSCGTSHVLLFTFYLRAQGWQGWQGWQRWWRT